MTHYPYAAWCELCVAHHARQDGHEPQPHVESGHSGISFDFGFAARNDEEDKLCALFLHDRHTGAMHVVPTPQKGGRWLNHLCTELCRFILWQGHPTISLKCDQEHSTLSLLDAVRKTCACLGVKTIVETVAPGSHASDGGTSQFADTTSRTWLWNPRRYHRVPTSTACMVTSSWSMVAKQVCCKTRSHCE